ncbi:MAG: NYN domain-containing protein [Eggerthellaceae bacterium]|nr:NYN domain-containing protein [Eggerthellaceae bacterium]
MIRRQKLLIVDGYNVLRSGSRYKAMAGADYTDDAFNRKREALLNDVVTFAGSEYEAIVVFDGGANVYSRGETETYGGIKIMFSPAGSSADRVIERLAQNARDRLQECLVVSSDATIQETVFGGVVARMSAEGFCRELAASYEENHQTFTPRPAKKNKISGRIDEDTLAKLKALRDSLS